MTLLSIKEATKWASEHLKKKVSPSNISYLVQYGKVKKHGNGKGVLTVTSPATGSRYNSQRRISLALSWIRNRGSMDHPSKPRPVYPIACLSPVPST